MKKILILISTLLFFGATNQTASLECALLVNTDNGIPIELQISGATEDDVFLGVSMYPYGVVDLLAEGAHLMNSIGSGDFFEAVKIEDSNLIGGSFEVALWGKKVPKIDCTIDDCYWCDKNGFHVEELLSYKTGYLSGLKGY